MPKGKLDAGSVLSKFGEQMGLDPEKIKNMSSDDIAAEIKSQQTSESVVYVVNGPTPVSSGREGKFSVLFLRDDGKGNLELRSGWWYPDEGEEYPGDVWLKANEFEMTRRNNELITDRYEKPRLGLKHLRPVDASYDAKKVIKALGKWIGDKKMAFYEEVGDIEDISEISDLFSEFIATKVFGLTRPMLLQPRKETGRKACALTTAVVETYGDGFPISLRAYPEDDEDLDGLHDLTMINPPYIARAVSIFPLRAGADPEADIMTDSFTGFDMYGVMENRLEILFEGNEAFEKLKDNYEDFKSILEMELEVGKHFSTPMSIPNFVAAQPQMKNDNPRIAGLIIDTTDGRQVEARVYGDAALKVAGVKSVDEFRDMDDDEIVGTVVTDLYGYFQRGLYEDNQEKLHDNINVLSIHNFSKPTDEELEKIGEYL